MLGTKTEKRDGLSSDGSWVDETDGTLYIHVAMIMGFGGKNDGRFVADIICRLWYYRYGVARIMERMMIDLVLLELARGGIGHNMARSEGRCRRFRFWCCLNC